MSRSFRCSTLVVVCVSSVLALSTDRAEAQLPGDVPPGAPVRIVSPLPIPTTATVSGTVTLDGTADVNVVNTTLTVRDVGATESTVNYSFTCSTSAIGCGPAIPYQVPAGHRFVIEYAGLRAFNLPAGEAAYLEIRTLAGAVSANFWLPPPTIALGGQSIQGQTVKLYADPSTFVSLNGLRLSGTGGGPSTTYVISLTGHLVPVD